MENDEIVKALRWIASNDELCFNAEQANIAADQLEQLNDFEQPQCMKLLEKIAEKNDVIHELQTENERLKAEKPVACGECKHSDFGKKSVCRCKNGIAQDSYVDKDDYCSYGERRVEE